MIQKDNKIELKMGDVFRFNRARKHHTVINVFKYGGVDYVIIKGDGEYDGFEVVDKERLCGIDVHYGNIYDGIVEVNGMIVRGTGGKLLTTPRLVVEKVYKPKPKKKELTDFQKFYKVQMDGKINMTDIVRGAALAGISEEKYEDILFHYDEYKEGKRQ
jgi:hypothetical protein